MACTHYDVPGTWLYDLVQKSIPVWELEWPRIPYLKYILLRRIRAHLNEKLFL